jgi:hypothetical protein
MFRVIINIIIIIVIAVAEGLPFCLVMVANASVLHDGSN